MKHLKIFGSLLLLVTLAAEADNPGRIKNPAQEFNNYIEMRKKDDVFISLPENLTPIDTRGNSDIMTSIGYGATVTSVDWKYATMDIGAILEDDSCRMAVCFPKIKANDTKALLGAKSIEADLRLANNDMHLDIRPLIKIVAEEDMSLYANADTAVIYEFEMFNRAFMESYPIGVGIYLKKKAHPSLLLRFMFDLYSVKDKDKYIRQILDNIYFGDNPSQTYTDLQAKVDNASDFNFPTKYRYVTGIVPSINQETLDEIKRVKAWCTAHGMKELPKLDDDVIEILEKANKATAQAQIEAKPASSDYLFDMSSVPVAPKFEEKGDKVAEWIAEHIQYPADARQAKIEGRVIVEFIIDKDGSIIEPKVIKGVSDSLNDEALRLVKSMPHWKAGRQNGKPVQTRYTLPINFRLSKAK